MFKVLTEGCEPTRGSKYSAGIDLYTSEDVTIGAGETAIVGLGVCIDSFDVTNTFYSEFIDPQTLQYRIGSKYYSYNDLQYAVDVWESYIEEKRNEGIRGIRIPTSK